MSLEKQPTLISQFKKLINHKILPKIQQVIEDVDPRRKLEACRKLENNYRSLPNVVHDDFFNSYTRCLFGDRKHRVNASKRNEVEKIQVQYRMNRGKFIRSSTSKLNQLRENKVSLHQRGQSRYLAKDEDEDFKSFLKNQLSQSRKAKLRIFQNKDWLNERIDRLEAPSNRRRHDSGGEESDEPKCYELFCIHQASLIVHRRQIFVEAERLAKRLAQLDDSG